MAALKLFLQSMQEAEELQCLPLQIQTLQKQVQERGVEASLLDLREYSLPFCAGSDKERLNHPHVKDVHDLHIWTISSGIPALSAHIQLYSECSDTNHWHSCLKNAQKLLRENFGIVHSTLQFEPEDYKRDCRII